MVKIKLVKLYRNNPQPKLNSKEGNIVVQKLCYYAQAMYLVLYGEPLFEDRILAQKNAPPYIQVVTEKELNTILERLQEVQLIMKNENYKYVKDYYNLKKL